MLQSRKIAVLFRLMAKKAVQYGTEEITFEELLNLVAPLVVAVNSLSDSMEVMNLLQLPSIRTTNIPTLRRTIKEIQPAIEAVVKTVRAEKAKRDITSGRRNELAEKALDAEAKANSRPRKKS